MNAYEVLGVSQAATEAEIKAAWRRVARDAHPDRGGSDQKFRQAEEAKRILLDQQLRAQHDRELAGKRKQSTVIVAGEEGLEWIIESFDLEAAADSVIEAAAVEAAKQVEVVVDKISARFEETARGMAEQAAGFLLGVTRKKKAP